MYTRENKKRVQKLSVKIQNILKTRKLEGEAGIMALVHF